MRFPQKTAEELLEFEHDVMAIIFHIETCPAIDLNKFSCGAYHRSRRRTQNQALEVRRAFSVAAHFRALSGATGVATQSPRIERSRKRALVDEDCPSPQRYYKAARVTPNQTPHF
jgi:hypothetical protein